MVCRSLEEALEVGRLCAACNVHECTLWDVLAADADPAGSLSMRHRAAEEGESVSVRSRRSSPGVSVPAVVAAM